MRRLAIILTLLLACAGTARAVEPWRDATFAKRIKVTLTAGEIGGDESDFPALLAVCLLYTSPSPRDRQRSRMPSSA